MRRWVPRPVPEPHAHEVEGGLPTIPGMPPPLLEVMARRGYSGERLFVFIDADPGALREWRSVPGAGDAASVLASAVRERRRVMVHGDYDADGMTATALLVSFLRERGSPAASYVPDRMTEGYGLGPAGVRECLESGSEVLVTVDCGIGSAEEVAELSRRGVEVVVTDHHRLDGERPPAAAVVDPCTEGPGAPGSELAGAGLAWTVAAAAEELLDGGGGRSTERLLPLAALGTVCDVVPLRDANRPLVRAGMERMRQSPPAGISALAEAASVDLRSLRSADLAFRLGPRLNSCGRTGNATLGLSLLLEEDPARAGVLASEVTAVDVRRRGLDARVRREAEEMAGRSHGSCVVLASPGWHRGVVGISASRLASLVGLPVVLLSVEGESAEGSARSVPGVPLYDLLAEVQERSGILERFGGHSMAAGLSLPAEDVPRLREMLERLLKERGLSPLLGPRLYVDGRLGGEHLDIGTVRALDMLEPFGEGNREPVWIARDVTPVRWWTVGRDSSHLSCLLDVDGRQVRAIGFHMAASRRLLEGRVDVAFRLKEDLFRGDGSVQLHLLGVRRARRS